MYPNSEVVHVSGTIPFFWGGVKRKNVQIGSGSWAKHQHKGVESDEREEMQAKARLRLQEF